MSKVQVEQAGSKESIHAGEDRGSEMSVSVGADESRIRSAVSNNRRDE